MKVMYHCLPLIYQWPQIPENKKSRAVTKIMQTSEQLGFTEKPDQENVIELLVQSLELLTNVFDKKKPTKSGRKMTSLETKQVVLKFCHDKSTHSTLMSRPASLKVSDKGKIESSLDFVSMVNIVLNKRGISFYENPWRITETAVKALYTNFLLTFCRSWSCLWNIPSLEAIPHKRSNKLRSGDVLL